MDSGKTSLGIIFFFSTFNNRIMIAKLMSQIKSTAAFDENPQSRERGITIDLGFSALQLDESIPIALLVCAYNHYQKDADAHLSIVLDMPH